MLLHLSDISNEPLHMQISRQIRAKILAGDFQENHELPSIRILAREQRVSVITIRRAYEDLDREGLINSRRGKGFYVASLSDGKKKTVASDRLKEMVKPALKDALAGGLSHNDVKKIVEAVIDGEVRKR
ncbi:MAG: GntR family transcriptional regulator [bacterium]